MLLRLYRIVSLLALVCSLPNVVAGAGPAGRLLLAKGFIQRGELAFAMDELEAILEQTTPDTVRTEATYWLGECHFRLEEYSTAARYFEQAAQTASGEWAFDALMRAGDSHLAVEEYAGAVNSFSRARHISVGAERAEASYWLGVALSRQGRHERAARAFAASVRLGIEDTVEAAYMAATSAMAASHWSLAESLWTAYLDAHPLADRAEEGLLSLGRLALRDGREVEAMRSLRQLLQRFPRGKYAAEASLLLAELELESGDPRSATATLERLVRTHPPDELAIQANFLLGSALSEAGRESAAVAVFDSLSATYPTDSVATQALIEAGTLLYAQGKFREAGSRLKAAIASELVPDRGVHARRLLGWSLYQDGKWADAAEAFRGLAELPEVDPEVAAEASHMEAQSLAKMESREAAVAALRASLAAFPAWSSADRSLLLLARLLEAQDRIPEAIEAYRQLTVAYPHSDQAAGAQLRAGQLLLEEGREEEAREVLQDLVRRQKGEPVYWLAEVHYRIGEPALAAEGFRDFLDSSTASDPLRDEAWHGLAWSQIRLDQPRSAEKTLVHMLEEVPESPLAAEAYLKLGSLQYDDGRPIEAAATFRQLLHAYPTSEFADQALYWLGWSLVARDSVEAACALFSSFHESYPRSQLAGRAKLSSGECLLSIKKPADALRELHLALEEDLPSDVVAEAWAAIAQCNLDMGANLQARAAIDSALASGGGVEDVGRPMLDLGRAWLDSRRDSLVVGLLDSLVSLFPSYPEAEEARYLLALAHLRLGEQEQAFQGFQGLVDSPDEEIRERALLAAGQLAASMGMYQQAVGWYERVLEEIADTALVRQALFGQAVARLELGQHSEAAPLLERLVVSFVPPRDKLWEQASLRWAELLREQQRHRRALQVARAVAEHGGEQVVNARLEMGRAFRSLGQHREAAREFLAYATARPRTTEGVHARYLAALSFMEAAQWDEAASLFSDLADDPEFSSEAMLARGWCLQKAGNDSLAEVSYQEVVARYPMTLRAWEARYRLGELLLGRDESARVAVLAREALMEGAGATEWGDDLAVLVARALERTGQREEATKWYRRVITDYPASQLVPYAESRIRVLE